MKSLLSLVGIAVGLVLYAFPLLGRALQNHRVLHYLDGGAFDILKAWEGIYTRGPFYWGAFDPLYIYPKAYYNIAGLFLYPYGFLYGENMPLTMVVWRLCSLLWSIGSLFALYQLTVFVFRSRLIATLCSLLFAFMPEFLGWAVNVRPDPMVNCMSFLALTFCAHLCQKYSARDFFLAALTGALAFAAKYGGIAFLFFVPLSILVGLWSVKKDQAVMTQIIEEQSAWIRRIYPVLFGTLFILWVLLLRAFSLHDFDAIQWFLALTKGVFPDELKFKVVNRLHQWKDSVQMLSWAALTGGLLLTLFVGSGWVLARKKQIRWPMTFLLGHFTLAIFCIYGVVFFLLSPAYVTNIPHFLSEFAYTVFYMSFGGSVGDGPRLGLWQYFEAVWSNIPGHWFFLGLLSFMVLIPLSRRQQTREWLKEQASVWLLAVYVLVVATLSFSLADPAIRHLLPGVAVLYIFAAATVVQGWRLWGRGILGKGVSIAVTLLLIGFSVSSIKASGLVWLKVRGCDTDIGLIAGEWLHHHYDANTRILTDAAAIYAPPKFTNVQTTTYVEWKSKIAEEQEALVVDLIKNFQPDIILVTTKKGAPREVVLDQLLLETGPFHGQYQRVKEFLYSKLGDRLDRIQVFERGNSSMASK